MSATIVLLTAPMSVMAIGKKRKAKRRRRALGIKESAQQLNALWEDVMGINICVYEKNGHEVPEWDSLRYAGDRDIADLIGSLPHEVDDDRIKPPDCERYIRPTDFAAWRKAAAEREWPNPGRFEKLIDVLEANPTAWVFASY